MIDDERISIIMAWSSTTARPHNKSHTVVSAVQCYVNAESVSLLQKNGSDGDARTDSGRLFQTDVAAAGKVRLPMVAREVD